LKAEISTRSSIDMMSIDMIPELEGNLP